MKEPIEVRLYTMCLVQDGDSVLLLERPAERGFPGYIGPGGKVEFPESLTEAVAREVKEETGLVVSDLVYKGLDEYCDPSQRYRYMVFNYIAKTYEGTICENPPEGELCWVPIKEALHLPMQPWFKRRFPLFFEEGTFEIYAIYDEKKDITLKETIKQLI